MKGKVLKYIGLVLASTFAVSCVEMPDEKGVDEIYAARIDFIKAQSSLKAAELKMKDALIASEVAKTHTLEMQAASIVLQNKIKETASAQDKARYEEELKVLSAKSQSEIVNAQVELVNAQQMYQVSLSELALDKIKVPERYMPELKSIKSKLVDLTYRITGAQNDLAAYNIKLTGYTLSDSVIVANELRQNYLLKKQTLDESVKVLSSLNQLSNSSNINDSKASLASKIKGLTYDIGVADQKVSIEYSSYLLSRSVLDSLYNLLSRKSDYRTSIAIPDAIKGSVEAYVNTRDKTHSFISSDKKSYIYVGNLWSLITELELFVSYAKSQAVTDDWTTFADLLNADLSKFKKQKSNLDAKYDNAYQIYRTRSYDYISTSSYANSLRSSLTLYQAVLADLENNVQSIDYKIVDQKKKVQENTVELSVAKNSLDYFLKTGWEVTGYSASSSMIKDLKDKISSLSIYITSMKEEFDLLSKQKDSLLALINSQTK